jgi:predicted CXXCH cytochrome family protein
LFRAAAVVAAVVLALAPALGRADLNGSGHDFSGEGWSGGEPCAVCHLPHDEDTGLAGLPLWNHQVTTASFSVYASATLNASVRQPDGISKLCLSCHDGTVALDSFGGASGSHFLSGKARIGSDLDDDHPISFSYDAELAAADSELYDPAGRGSGLGGTVDADLLFGGKLECASCHDVHNQAGNRALLRVSNVGSALCLTCHRK